MISKVGCPEECAGVSWRVLELDDAHQLMHLAARIENYDSMPYRSSPEECDMVLSDVENTLIVGAFEITGLLVAYALVRVAAGGSEAFCSGGVDPQWRGRGIGCAALEWQVSVANEQVGCTSDWRIAVHVNETQVDVIELLRRRGFMPDEGFTEMSRCLGRILPRVPRQAFTEIVAWEPQYANQVRALWNRISNKCVSDAIAGEWVDEPAFFEPKCSCIALDTAGDRPRVIGFLRTTVYPQDFAALGHSEAYVNDFCVDPEAGMNTVGRSLVIAVMRACARHRLAVLSGGISNSKINVMQMLRSLKFSERGKMRRFVLTAQC